MSAYMQCVVPQKKPCNLPDCVPIFAEWRSETIKRKNTVMLLSAAAHCKATKKGKKRKDYAFWRQCNKKPSIIPGCPGARPQRPMEKIKILSRVIIYIWVLLHPEQHPELVVLLIQ